MDYFSKYLKYKNKYISLKNNINLQKGAAKKSNSNSNSAKGRVNTCTECQKTFTNWHMFDTHIASHKKCKNCPLLEFTSMAGYKLHIDECNKQKQSFRHPMHAKPELIAQTFNPSYEPQLTIKIDGVFYNNKSTQFFNSLPAHWRSIEGELYRPRENVPPLLFIFKVTVPSSHIAGQDCSPATLADPLSKELSISEMMRELNHCAGITNANEIPEIPNRGRIDVDEISRIFADDIIQKFRRNLEEAFRYRDTAVQGSDVGGVVVREYSNRGDAYPWEGEENINRHVTNCKWVPKLYIDLMPYIQQENLSHSDKWNLYVKTLDRILQLITEPVNRDFIKHDGLVITPNPPNKCCLVKIKPKEEMTIDLKYNGNQHFSSGDGIDVSSFIDPTYLEQLSRGTVQLDINGVYRCYPNAGSLFVPLEKREEGKSANGHNHCLEIQSLHRRYFNLSELVDINKLPPWYVDENINREQLTHLYGYSQGIYKAYIHHMVEKYKNDRRASILDIGCGSAGQYVREFSQWTGGYVGIDIDISKLAEGEQKFQKLPGTLKYVRFIPININIPWDRATQDRFFNDQGLWGKFYGEYYDNHLNTSLVSAGSVASAAGGGGAVDAASKIFKIVLSIFSSHYSNNTQTTWDQYVREINSRTESGSELFIIFLDSDKIEDKQTNPEYSVETRASATSQFRLTPGASDSTRGDLTISPFPQGTTHTEPILRTSHIRDSFRDNFTRQPIPAEVQALIVSLRALRDADRVNTAWNNYIDCISFYYLIKK